MSSANRIDGGQDESFCVKCLWKSFGVRTTDVCESYLQDALLTYKNAEESLALTKWVNGCVVKR